MLGDQWYYSFDTPYSDINSVWLVSKEYWEENQCLSDQHISDDVTLPFENTECQESLFEFYCTEEEAERLLLENGFSPRPRKVKP
jgi:hypothetical protein